MKIVLVTGGFDPSLYKKQFEDPYQIELRRTKCNKIQGMKIYHNYLRETKYYPEGLQPDGWVIGRPPKKGGVA
jgi:hypothetical protein